MTTTTVDRIAEGDHRLSSAGVLRAELRKLTSLRSTRIAGASVPLLVVGGMALRAFAYAQTAAAVSVGVPSGAAWGDVLDTGVSGGELAVIVLIALVVGSDLAGRTALSTFVASPRRLLVLGAKALVALGATAVLTAVGFVAGTAVSAPIMATAHLGRPTPATAGAALGDLVVVLAIAALTFSITTLVRSTAGGITIALAVLLVLPGVVGLLGRVAGVDLEPLLLTYAAPMVTALHDPAGAGALVRDALVSVAWLVVPGAAAAAALVRRDV